MNSNILHRRVIEMISNYNLSDELPNLTIEIIDRRSGVKILISNTYYERKFIDNCLTYNSF